MSNDRKGVIFSAISALAFSFGGLLVKLIPWNSFSIISGRCVFSSIFLIVYFIITKQKLKINKTTVTGAILVMLNMVTYITANKLTTAANTIILEYTAPVYIILFSLIFLKQRVTKLKLFTVLFVFIGIVLTMAGSIGKGNMLGNIIAAINGAIYGISMMVNHSKNGDSISSTLMGHILCIFVGIPSLIHEVNFSSITLTYVALLGIFQSGLGYLMMALGLKHTDPLTVSLISYLEPILNPIWVLIFYNESISLLSVVGIFIVLITIIVYNNKINKMSKE